eukprot:GHRR01011058.1.p2 GENE.GHRR01011058.1~~GHRR01011058.1.p2  ORF type:complete len:105 (+),score=14.10 GHRR01011058.1:15-329(+)
MNQSVLLLARVHRRLCSAQVSPCRADTHVMNMMLHPAPHRYMQLALLGTERMEQPSTSKRTSSQSVPRCFAVFLAAGPWVGMSRAPVGWSNRRPPRWQGNQPRT